MEFQLNFAVDTSRRMKVSVVDSQSSLGLSNLMKLIKLTLITLKYIVELGLLQCPQIRARAESIVSHRKVFPTETADS